MLAFHDKEIYYYIHASQDDIDGDFFENTSVADFVEDLRGKQAASSSCNNRNRKRAVTSHWYMATSMAGTS